MCAIFIFQMYPQCTYKDTQSPLNIKRSSHLDYESTQLFIKKMAAFPHCFFCIIPFLSILLISWNPSIFVSSTTIHCSALVVWRILQILKGLEEFCLILRLLPLILDSISRKYILPAPSLWEFLILNEILLFFLNSTEDRKNPPLLEFIMWIYAALCPCQVCF